MYLISFTKQLWVSVCSRDIVGYNLHFSPYWKDIDTMNANELRGLVLHTLRLDRRLSLHSPPIEHSLHQRRSITWVQLVQSQWLLVASSDDIASVITVWSIKSLLSSDSKTPLAEAFLSAPVATGKVDMMGDCVILALELCGKCVLIRLPISLYQSFYRTPHIEILTIVTYGESIVFSRLRKLRDIAHLRFLKGDYVGVSVLKNTNVPCIVNWKECFFMKLRTMPDLQVSMRLTL